jgi:hypothetical protein
MIIRNLAGIIKLLVLKNMSAIALTLHMVL